MSENSQLQSEWSYSIKADKITADVSVYEFRASEQESKDLARRLGLVSIDSVEASVKAKREDNKRTIRIEGTIIAHVVQNCVVSGDEIEQNIEDNFEAFYAEPNDVVLLSKVRHERQGNMEGAEQPIMEERDDPEAIVDGMIDLGELAAQYLSLAVNPYAHKEGYVLEEQHPDIANKEIPQTRKNPFSTLKALKEKIDK